MRVVCAWCEKDGQPALLRIEEPVDDPTESHGICERHAAALLEEFLQQLKRRGAA